MMDVKESSDGLVFSVYVQPRSSKTAIIGDHQNALKIKLTAPPVGGAANKQCIQILAKALDLPKSAVKIITGQTGRRKQIRVQPMHGKFKPADIKALKRKLYELAQ
ncbi:MAG: DUF167 domain-containing protein [Desulfobacteraceae bacterium]|jgi:uncharacterized protein (TIGR00251 family)